MAVQSKLTPITTTCIEYVHPWTNSCSIATAGLILQAAQDSFRIYSVVYSLSLAMRGRIPSKRDLIRAIQGTLRSTAFLTTSAFTFCLFLCIIRKYIGGFNFFTVSYVPAFLSSICAILIERPSRRGLLTLYVSNVATETWFRMAVSRNLIKPIRYGEIIIFGLSTSIMLYYFRMGLHKQHNDSLFDILRFVIGNSEEKIINNLYNTLTDEDDDDDDDEDEDAGDQENENSTTTEDNNEKDQSIVNNTSDEDEEIVKFKPSIRIINGENNINYFPLIQKIVSIYTKFMEQLKSMQKHLTCPHEHSCLHYLLKGGCKLFTIGLGVQISIKLIFQINRIIRNPKYIMKLLFNKDTLKLGIFLGGFSSIFRCSSCIFRHFSGKDHPMYAIPATLLASLAFGSYPDTTIALYVMWKMLQITYNIGVERKYLPKIPGFMLFLYCASTATLFHAAILEPNNLRSSYFKFLHSLSGGRVAGMDRKPLDVWGLETSQQLLDTLKRTRTNLEIHFTL